MADRIRVTSLMSPSILAEWNARKNRGEARARKEPGRLQPLQCSLPGFREVLVVAILIP